MTWTGVLGGTFDPPHLAHLVLAAAARRALALDRVLLVPAGDPWRKADRAVTAATTRLRLMQTAVEDSLPWAEVSAIEVEREGPSYSVDTLAQLTAAAGGGALWFILGGDALADLPNWHEPDRLVSLARLAVAQRGPEWEPIPEAARAAVPGLAERVDFVAMPRLAVSASDLRRRVRARETTAPLLPAPVRRLIDELGLYREG